MAEAREHLVFVVDDEPTMGTIVERWLANEAIRSKHLASGEECLQALESALPDVVLLDVHMPGLGGIKTLEKIKAMRPDLPVVMSTGESGVDTIIRAMQLGACDYMVKPLSKTRVLTTLRRTLEVSQLKRTLEDLQHRGASFAGMVGASEPMRHLFRAIRRVASSDVSVLVLGESGTGKELVARAIHGHSQRQAGSWVAVNCAAIPESLQESELFGHEKGAFTDAADRRLGRFEQAHRGTLFLDEVGELSPTLQAKLLRVLQERTFRRVGGSVDVRSDFRLVAATHRPLFDLVKDGTFREDLYYRLAVFELTVPPLRDRGNDLSLLAHSFVTELADKIGRKAPRLSSQAVKALRRHRWPGNVRELQNALQYAVTLATEDTIDVDDLPHRLTAQSHTTSQHLPPISLEELERLAIEQALERTGGKVLQAADLLGINRTTLYRKLKRSES